MSDGIDIEGLAPLLQGLEHAPEIVEPELRRTTEAALLSLLPDAKAYPAPPAGSTYRRTNNLARGWAAAKPEITAAADSFQGTLTNRLVLYGPYVQDEEEQADVHLDRWDTVQDIMADHADEIEEYFAAAAERIAARLEGQG